jgi:hypothetical protein
MMELSDARCTLSDLQWNVLIPLELEMADRPELERMTPTQWVEIVDRAIRNEHSALEQ